MARTKTVTQEALAALGAEALAEVLIAHAATDPTLRKKLGMLLAGTEGPGKLAAEIDKRIKTIGRSRSIVDWEKRKPLVQELDHLRVTMATRLARQDAARAVELLWDFIGIADAVMQRVGEGIGEVEDVFGTAMEDLGRLSAAEPRGDAKALARRVLAYCERDGFGATDALIRHMSEALGAGGRAEIRRATEGALKTAPRSSGPQDWRADAKRRHLAFRLALLADLEKDADAFIAAIRAGAMESTHALEVAERLITANRPAEALDWLDKPRRRDEDEDDDGTDTDLRIAALEAHGRKDEAQSVRWQHFERFLSAEHLRAYLKRLPDFEDFEAEQKALDVAAAHKQAARGLAFFITWRAHDRADRLVRERLTALDGRLYEVLRPAAEALEEKFPEAASLLYRRLIESVLERGSSKQYQYAARDLQGSPMKMVEALWGGELPTFDSIDDANELIGALVMGLWNRLTHHQERSAPWRRSARCWKRPRSWPRTRANRRRLTISSPQSVISGN